ncbi:hypothetical protein FKM82_025056 [Ascaphus truei]
MIPYFGLGVVWYISMYTPPAACIPSRSNFLLRNALECVSAHFVYSFVAKTTLGLFLPVPCDSLSHFMYFVPPCVLCASMDAPLGTAVEETSVTSSAGATRGEAARCRSLAVVVLTEAAVPCYRTCVRDLILWKTILSS